MLRCVRGRDLSQCCNEYESSKYCCACSGFRQTIVRRWARSACLLDRSAMQPGLPGIHPLMCPTYVLVFDGLHGKRAVMSTAVK